MKLHHYFRRILGKYIFSLNCSVVQVTGQGGGGAALASALNLDMGVKMKSAMEE